VRRFGLARGLLISVHESRLAARSFAPFAHRR
jgi:hypothetical protein